MLALKEKHLVVIKSLESEIKTYRNDLALNTKYIDTLKSDHAASISDALCAQNSQVKAIKEQHLTEVNKVKTDLRRISDKLKEEKKISNQVRYLFCKF